jgi:two-component system, OmpR family, response regulator CpxR
MFLGRWTNICAFLVGRRLRRAVEYGILLSMMAEKPRVLLVDDDADFANILGDALTRDGFLVRKCYDGNACLGFIHDAQFDLIILDLRMPVKDGAETLHDLRKTPQGRAITVLVLTSFNEYGGMKMDEACAKKLGADAFLDKSADISLLVRRIRGMIARKGRR